MENLPRNLEKEIVKAAGKPSKFKKKEKWTLLLINDSGKTIQIKGLQILVKAAVFLVLAVILSAGGIYSFTKFKGFESLKSFISMPDISNNRKKEDVVKEAIINETPVKQDDISLNNTDTKTQDEKKSDTAKENISKENINDDKDKIETDENISEPASVEIAQKSENEDKQEEINQSDKIQKSSPANKIQENSPVSIDDFDFSYKAGRDFLDIKFNIKNNSSDSDSVSGHVVVVLKDNKTDRRKWIALPDDIKLVSGRPTGEDAGQTFSISFFKTLHFRAKKQTNPDRYKMATIYIYSREGDLLLEQDQDIIINQDN